MKEANKGYSLIEVMVAVWALVLFQLLIESHQLAIQARLIRAQTQLVAYVNKP